MSLFPEYELSGREYRTHYLYTRLLGLLPIGVSLLFLLARASRAGPGLWCVMGVCVGLELILWGSFKLYFLRQQQTRLGASLAAASDSWFPYLLFSLQNIFFILVLLMLWFTLSDLGFPAQTIEHSLFVLLLIMIPVRRFIRRMQLVTPSSRIHFTDRIFRYLTAIIATLFVGGCMTRFMIPPGTSLTWHAPPGVVFVWVIGILIILGCLLLIFDGYLRYKKNTGNQDDF